MGQILVGLILLLASLSASAQNNETKQECEIRVEFMNWNRSPLLDSIHVTIEQKSGTLDTYSIPNKGLVSISSPEYPFILELSEEGYLRTIKMVRKEDCGGVIELDFISMSLDELNEEYKRDH